LTGENENAVTVHTCTQRDDEGSTLHSQEIGSVSTDKLARLAIAPSFFEKEAFDQILNL
jgi:hypothetical protein